LEKTVFLGASKHASQRQNEEKTPS